MKKLTGMKCIMFVLIAFAGLGIEVALAFLIEPIVYGSSMNNWNTFQNIAHWIITCISWGFVSYFIINLSKKKYGFDLMEKGTKVKNWQWILIILFVIMSLIISYIDWNGSKVLKEFNYNGLLKFIFQYIYYTFEVMLVTLILIFGQKAFEKWFNKVNIPYGGIILALTWGVAHFFTKNISTGIITIISSLAFGSVYLLVNRDIRKTYPILWIMFVL